MNTKERISKMLDTSKTKAAEKALLLALSLIESHVSYEDSVCLQRAGAEIHQALLIIKGF